MDEGLAVTEELIISSLEHELATAGSVREAAAAVVHTYRPRNTNVVIRHVASGEVFNARDVMAPDDPAAIFLRVPRIDSIVALLGNALEPTAVGSVRSPDGSFRIRRRTLQLGGETVQMAIFRAELEKAKTLGELRRQWPWLVLLLVVALAVPYLYMSRGIAFVTDLQANVARIADGDLQHRFSVPPQVSPVWVFLVDTLNQLMDRVARRDEEHRAFMASAAHELRTPVAVISGESQVALERDDNDPRQLRASLRLIRQESQVMARLVEDLFLLARLRTGEAIIQTAPLYLDDLLDDCRRALNALPFGAGRVHARVESGPFDYRGDEALLQRAIMNLATNALKHSPESELVTLTLDRSGDAFIIQVIDHGEGIAREDQERIFQRFYRGRDGRSRMDGAGLGLAIARGLAELHGGTLELASTGPGGTTFRLTLPVTPGASTRVRPTHDGRRHDTPLSNGTPAAPHL